MIKKVKLIWNNQSFRKYFFNTGWLFSYRIISMIVSLFVGAWVARYLGPDKLGILSYAQSFVSLFFSLASLGIDGIVIREIVKNENERENLIGTAFWLKLTSASIVILILFVFIYFSNNSKLTNYLILIISVCNIFQSFNVFDLYFQAKVQSKFVVIANFMVLFASSILKIILMLSEAPLITFAFAILFDSIILASGLIYFYYKKMDRSLFSSNNFKLYLPFHITTAKFLLRNSWPLIISGIFLMIQARIDQVMIFEMLGSKENGYYSVAMRMIESLAFMPGLIATSLFPALANAKMISEKHYNNRFLNYYRLSFLLFLITAIPIFLFSDQIIILLFGSEFQPAGFLLSLLSIRLFFTYTGVARDSFITIENLFKFSMITMIFGSILNVLLNYYLIPVYGSIGVIIASIFSFFVTTFLIDFIYIKTRDNVKLQFLGMLTFFKLNLRN